MTLATETPVPVSEQNFQTMLNFAKTIDGLQYRQAYLDALTLHLPSIVDVQPKRPPILMGYDFHLTDDGPKLIEINNNAGGLWEKDDGWIPQCEHEALQGSLKTRLLNMFDAAWKHIAIMDEDITNQYMYSEMQAYAKLLEADGRKVSLVSPEALKLQDDGLHTASGRVDVIYNRHTDFYLESGVLSHIRQAYLDGKVDLNPYSRSYALIGDKNRMVDWWREGLLDFLPTAQVKLIHQVVPETHVLAELETEQAWVMRKQWVFKPAARHGGKGVLLGKAMSRKRFNTLDIQDTVVQQLVPASTIEINQKSFKFDIRLYMFGDQLVALAGRAWNGQITNFREEGSGWTPISIKS
ncbi:MAG TPA: hypothetical protein EYP39_02165 [Ghiorsea sp.]|nr:hypothetical protein [Ghiorsea sp.]HIP06699.1 hypothetical protein [Mariprofundaceae bacterium]